MECEVIPMQKQKAYEWIFAQLKVNLTIFLFVCITDQNYACPTLLFSATFIAYCVYLPVIIP